MDLDTDIIILQVSGYTSNTKWCTHAQYLFWVACAHAQAWKLKYNIGSGNSLCILSGVHKLLVSIAVFMQQI